jgi:hypothetical protein
MLVSTPASSWPGVPMMLARSASDSESLRLPEPVLLLDRLPLLLAAACTAAARSAARLAKACCACLLKRLSWIKICERGGSVWVCVRGD